MGVWGEKKKKLKSIENGTGESSVGKSACYTSLTVWGQSIKPVVEGKKQLQKAVPWHAVTWACLYHSLSVCLESSVVAFSRCRPEPTCPSRTLFTSTWWLPTASKTWSTWASSSIDCVTTRRPTSSSAEKVLEVRTIRWFLWRVGIVRVTFCCRVLCLIWSVFSWLRLVLIPEPPLLDSQSTRMSLPGDARPSTWM